MQWYYASQGKQAGPVDDAALEQLIRQGVVQPQTLVWREGMAQWQPISVARPAPAAAPVPAPAPAAQPFSPQPQSFTPQSSFGQPQQQQPNPFGQPSTPQSGFGQPQQPSSSSTIQFGQGGATAGNFGGSPQSSFGQPSSGGGSGYSAPTQPVASGFGAPVGSSAQTITCANCGQLFPTSSAVMIGSSWVCATCKPVYMQRMREGGVSATTATGLRLAGFWVRFAARMIDSLIFAIPFGIVIVLMSGVIGAAAGGASSDGLGILGLIGGLLYLVLIAGIIFYEIYFIATKGATYGKQFMGLKVVRADGGPLSMGRSAGRFGAYMLNSFIPLAIGFLLAAFDKEKRALHDMICDTRVITTR